MLGKEKSLSWLEEAAMETTSSERLDYLAKNGDYFVRLRVSRNRSTSPETLAQLAKDEDYNIQRSVAINPHTPDEILSQFVAKKMFLKEVAGNPNASGTTLEGILYLQPDPDVRGLKKIVFTGVTYEVLTEVYKIVVKHPNLPERYLDELLQEGRLSIQDCHEAKAKRNVLPISLKVKDFLPYIHNNSVAILAYTEQAEHENILAMIWSEGMENENKLEKSIDFYRTERQKKKEPVLSSEQFTADDLLDATIIRIGTFPSGTAGSKSTITLTIREVEELKETNYFMF